MLVYNISDRYNSRIKDTPFLRMSFVIGGKMVEPGKRQEIEDTLLNRRAAQSLVALGVAAVDQLPAGYAVSPIVPKGSTEEAPVGPMQVLRNPSRELSKGVARKHKR